MLNSILALCGLSLPWVLCGNSCGTRHHLCVRPAAKSLIRPHVQVQQHDKVLQIMLEDEMRTVDVK